MGELIPNLYANKKERTNRFVVEKFSLFYLRSFCYCKSEVVLCTVKLLALTRSEVKLAHHFAIRRNFTHKVNFTILDNFTCP